MLENEIKGLLTARSLAEIETKETERLKKEYQALIDLQLAVTKVRNAFVDSTTEVHAFAKRPSGMARHLTPPDRSVENSKAVLTNLRAVFGRRDVYLGETLEALIPELLVACDNLLAVKHAILNRALDDLGPMNAYRGVVEKLAEDAGIELRTQVQRLKLGAKTRASA